MHSAPDASHPIARTPWIRGAAALTFAASLAAGGLGIARDIRVAFRDAGPSNVPGSIRAQIASIEKQVPAGEAILLVSDDLPDELWYTRLVQRAMYPRHAVIIRYLPLRRRDADALRRRWAIRYGVSFGQAPPDVGYLHPQDLGPLPAMAHRVWAGELSPP